MIKLQYLLLVALVLFAVLFVSLTISVQQSSPLKQFNVTPDVVYLNWTNNYTSNITVTINASFDGINVTILNTTSNVAGNYSQANSGQVQCTASCYHLFVKNSTGDYVSVTPTLNGTNSTEMTILDTDILFNHLRCSPGRYWIEKLTIRNTTRTNETANITVFIDLPISSSNNANILSTGVGTFGGGGAKLPINASTYHSYYFNTSLVTNATGVMINLTGWSSSQDVDLFLFDNSSTPVLKAKSVNKTHTVESLLYNYLPSTEKMWEIRVYGNDTSTISYNGVIVFTTLNTTNYSIDFGVKNASDTSQFTITLKNEGNLTLSNVVESKELYHVNKFGGNSAKNFTFLVPDSSIASKVKASLNWTGGSNYSLKIYNQNDALVASSMNKYAYANVTGAMQEEYNETTSISAAGVWKVGVENNTNVTDNYNVTVYTYVSPTNWTTTNYTTMTFNRTGNNNYTVDVQINFTVQNNSMDGLYEGYIKYLDNNNVGLKIPISFNVTTPMLIVNDTLNSVMITVDENNGTSLTKSFDVLVNNTGSYGLNLDLTNSSNDTMSCVSGTGCSSGYFANFTYNSISSVSSHFSDTLSVNMTYNSSIPVGIYEGWILLNATNTTTALASHPYETFNLTFRLNLTNLLEIKNLQIISVDGDTIVGNASQDENVTAKFKIDYVNRTEIEAKTALNTSNFTIWLVSENVSSHRIPTSGGLSLYNGTNPIYNSVDHFYSVNFTVPANSVGGRYAVHVMANYTRNPSYGGTGTNQSLIINNTGLHMSTNATGCSFDQATCTSSFSLPNGSSNAIKFYVNVSNYGPKAASSATINFSENCGGYSVAATNLEGCTGIGVGTLFTISPSAYSTTCLVWWTITPGSSAASACTSNIIGDSTTNKWFDTHGINTSITVTEPPTTTTTVPSSEDTDGTTGGDEDEDEEEGTAAVYLEIKSYPTTLSIEQAKNTTEPVVVENINDTVDQTVTLEITGIDSSWYSLDTSEYEIDAGEKHTYMVTFLIPENATVKDYACTFKASSSYTTVSKTFTLGVTPCPKMQEEINTSMSNYEIQISDLETLINQTRDQGKNTTIAESKFSELKDKLKQALDYRNTGDYKSAYELFDDIDTLFNETKTALEEAGIPTGSFLSGDWWGWGKWVVIVVVVVVVAILGYMFWPTKLGESKPTPKAMIQRAMEGKKDKISESFANLKERLKKIKEGNR